MIPLIAWRNIWRSRSRSMVVIGAVIVGLWSLVFAMSFSYGIIVSYINNGIQNQYSHIQLHQPQFLEDNESKYIISNDEKIIADIAQKEEVKSVASRLLSLGMIKASRGARGIRIIGVDPATESKLTKLDTKIVDGNYFEEGKRNPVLISVGLAEKLRLKVRSKVVLEFQDVEGEAVNASFRVAGLFDSKFAQLDDSRLFIRKSDMGKLMKAENGAHQIAVFLKNPNTLDTALADIKGLQPNLKTESWREVAPELELMETSFEINIFILMTIILLALTFGIINTMLMAVLERIKELGMLMAVGMNKVRVFSMIVLETIMLTFVGAPIGICLGFLTVRYLNRTGIDLSNFSEGLREFGVNELVRPDLEWNVYFILAAMVGLTAILASIYPALKAISLKPVEAIRGA